MIGVGSIFVIVGMLFYSPNISIATFAQTNTDPQTNTGAGGNSLLKQNYDTFQSCLDNISGTSGFATPPQIRGCLIVAYNISDDDDDWDDWDDVND
jgi:hypothetical protein